jgi:hypothetical protein
VLVVVVVVHADSASEATPQSNSPRKPLLIFRDVIILHIPRILPVQEPSLTLRIEKESRSVLASGKLDPVGPHAFKFPSVNRIAPVHPLDVAFDIPLQRCTGCAIRQNDAFQLEWRFGKFGGGT